MFTNNEGALVASQGGGTMTNVEQPTTKLLLQSLPNIGLSSQEDLMLNGKQMICLLSQGICFYYPSTIEGDTFQKDKLRPSKDVDYDVDTDSFWRLRRTTAEINRLKQLAVEEGKSESEIGKYDQAKGSEVQPYLFPFFKWIERNGITEQDTIDNLIITEGEKKAIMLSFRLNVPAIAISGITAYKALKSPIFVALLNKYNIRNVSFLYDGDMFNFGSSDVAVLDGRNRIQNFATSIEGVYEALNDIDRHSAFKKRKPSLYIRCSNPHIANYDYGYKAVDDFPVTEDDSILNSLFSTNKWYEDDCTTKICLLKVIPFGLNANERKGIGNQICRISSDAHKTVLFRHIIGSRLPSKLVYKSNNLTYNISVNDDRVSVVLDEKLYVISDKIYIRQPNGSVEETSINRLQILDSFVRLSSSQIRLLTPTFQHAHALGAYIPNDITLPYTETFEEDGLIKVNTAKKALVEVADTYSPDDFPTWTDMLKQGFQSTLYKKNSVTNVTWSSYEFVLNWIKSLVYDSHKETPAIFLYSKEQSCGKSVIMESIANLMTDTYSAQLEKDDYSNPIFNIKLMGKLFLFADEASDNKDRSLFYTWLKKNISGTKKGNYTAKGKDTISADKYYHLMMASNDIDSVNMDEEQTRVIAIELSKRRGVSKNKEVVLQQLKNEAPYFLAYLRDMPYSKEWLEADDKRFAEIWTTECTEKAIEEGNVSINQKVLSDYVYDEGIKYHNLQYIPIKPTLLISYASDKGKDLSRGNRNHLPTEIRDYIDGIYRKYIKMYPNDAETIKLIDEDKQKKYVRKLTVNGLKDRYYCLITKVAYALNMIDTEEAEFNRQADNSIKSNNDTNMPF